jgi:hypothetical protein
VLRVYSDYGIGSELIGGQDRGKKEIAFVILGRLAALSTEPPNLRKSWMASAIHSYTHSHSPPSPNVPQASLLHVRQSRLVLGRHDAVENLARPGHGGVGPVNRRLRQVLGSHDTASDVVDSLQQISQFLVKKRKSAIQIWRKYIPI